MSMDEPFVYVDEFVCGVRWDAKYATWGIFTGKPVDGYFANRGRWHEGSVRSTRCMHESRR